jgi:GNAT superfamily N-acetyltransferase
MAAPLEPSIKPFGTQSAFPCGDRRKHLTDRSPHAELDPKPINKHTHHLQVVQIETIEKINELIPTLANWRAKAMCLLAQAERQEIPESDRYESARDATTALIRDFSSPTNFSEKFYLACYDADEQLQGCMLLTPSYLAGHLYEGMPYIVIDQLLTNPSNISSSLIHASQRISGVATALINKAEEICQAEKADGLILHPDPSAIGFYKRLRFQEIGIFMKKDL